jgi:hypothetical protein
MFGVRRSAPAHAPPQFFARIARASRVLAKASRLRGLLIVAAVADRGIPASLLFLLADRSR